MMHLVWVPAAVLIGFGLGWFYFLVLKRSAGMGG